MTESVDPLDNEVAVSVEVTATGVQAKSKSRLISGLDRLVGNLSDWLNVRLEDGNSTQRAITEGKKKLIEAATKAGVQRIESDASFADRAIDQHFKGVLAAQENRDAVASKILEDLKGNPPTAEQSAGGPDELAPEILDRLETYASGASTNELRERWARVAAAEIRQPGTFSLKVLRIIDELDQRTALLFENFTSHRIGRYIPKILSKQIKYDDQITLVDAGLLVDPGLGQSTSFINSKFQGGDYWLWRSEPESIMGIPIAEFAPHSGFDDDIRAVVTYEGKPAVSVYVLTSAGLAICEILPPVSNSVPYFRALKEQYATARRWRISAGSSIVDVTDT